MKEINKNINELLKKYQHVSVIGISNNPLKPSYQVAQYLKNAGYKIYPVNPNYSSVLGEKCYPGLKSIPDKIDIVDIFRPSEQILPIVYDAIAIQAQVVWMQLGIQNTDAAQRALEADINVVMNRCMKIEHMRLF